jgi:hypothetical protein
MENTMIHRTALWGTALSILLLASATHGQVRYGSFPLSGSEAVPSNGSVNTGTATCSLDLGTNVLSWNISYTGIAATAAHFHGNALPGQVAGVQLNIGTANPAVNSAAIFAADSADILNGLWYVNIHSGAFPGGEIRGQVRLSWEDLGGGTVGINGQPTLIGGGPLTAGSTATLDLTQAPFGSLTLAWLSFASVPQAFFGGVIHALPFAQQFLFVTNAVGELHLAVAWPTSIPSGTNAWIQFLCDDPSVLPGITLSNAVKLTTP